MKEGVFNLGETEDKEQEKAIKFALLEQRVDILEKWKSGYEEAQNQKWEAFEKKMDKNFDNITSQIISLTNQINEQKSNWFNKVPWFISLLFSGLISACVYLIAKK